MAAADYDWENLVDRCKITLLKTSPKLLKTKIAEAEKELADYTITKDTLGDDKLIGQKPYDK